MMTVLRYLFVMLLVRMCATMLCKFPAQITEFGAYPTFATYAKGTQFTNLYISDVCVSTDGPCNRGYTGPCGTYNNRNVYLGSNYNHDSLISNCNQITHLLNIQLVDGFRASINVVRLVLQCRNLCSVVNGTYFWSVTDSCPVFQ